MAEPPPARTGGAGGAGGPLGQGHPLARLAADAAFSPVTVTRYGKTATIQATAITCLRYSVFGTRPVQAVLIRDASATGYDLALVTTDLDTSLAHVIERNAARWNIEVATEKSKQVFGTGRAGAQRRRSPGRAHHPVPARLPGHRHDLVRHHRPRPG
jgi:hypothetical protein